MLDKIKALAVKLDKLSFRERVLIFVAVIVGITQGWDFWLWTPMTEHQEQQQAQIDNLNKDMLQLQIDLKILTARATLDPDVEVKKQIKQLTAQLDAVNKIIHEASQSLVTPAQMAELLEDMFVNQRGLKLLRLDTLKTVPLIKPAKDEPPIVDYQIYRHGFAIEFSGGFMATLRYLEALEQLKDRFFWEGIDYKVEEYPDSRVRLNLYTLSLSEGFIGV